MRIVKEINKEALLNNIDIIQNKIDNAKIMAVVKSNAYGHGMKEVVDVINDRVDMYAVANINEAVELRRYLKEKNSNKEILIIGYFDESKCNDLINFNIIQSITNFESLDIIEKEICSDEKVKVHIIVNTGMNRLGFDIDDEFFERIKKYNKIMIDGIFSHIPYADNYDEQKEIEKRFDMIIEEFKSNNIQIEKKHLLNSAGMFNDNLKRYDYVRPGIILYGYYPSDVLEENFLKENNSKQLNKVITIKTKIINIRNIKKGNKVSYEGTYEAPSDKVIATLPVGYDDGYLRSNSNKARVFVNGKYANVVGRVCMNLMMIDVTDIDVSLGDEVILLGEEISAEELAKISQTISYEILCNFKFE